MIDYKSSENCLAIFNSILVHKALNVSIKRHTFEVLLFFYMWALMGKGLQDKVLNGKKKISQQNVTPPRSLSYRILIQDHAIPASPWSFCWALPTTPEDFYQVGPGHTSQTGVNDLPEELYPSLDSVPCDSFPGPRHSWPCCLWALPLSPEAICH